MNDLLKIKKTLIIIIGITFLSCERNVEEESGIISEELCDPAISFSTDIKSIIDNNCISCHGGNQAPDLRTYESINNNSERVRTQVVNRTMPLGGSLSNDQIELIRCWIENGALNN
ncbi:cytochrome c [Aquimarina sp. LLG6339-5]|uniref:cytochrome c n=1 Tax=Aquimarina sp. LLG6339-5 TaxID=3160830 RepID=UPI00386757E3